MSTGYELRAATEADIPFLAEAILGAEASGSDKAGIATLFDLPTEEANSLVQAMLAEEIDGCEFSVSSFLVATLNGMLVAATAGWVEGESDDLPSGLLKSNLIGFTFPQKNREIVATRRDIIGGIQIERRKGSLQIEYVFVRPEHRGHGLAAMLIGEHLIRAGAKGVDSAQVQVFANNVGAVHSYEKSGFAIAGTFRTGHPDALRFLPWNEKLLMQRTINV